MVDTVDERERASARERELIDRGDVASRVFSPSFRNVRFRRIISLCGYTIKVSGHENGTFMEMSSQRTKSTI